MRLDVNLADRQPPLSFQPQTFLARGLAFRVGAAAFLDSRLAFRASGLRRTTRRLEVISVAAWMFAILAMCALSSDTSAQDWPQILGVNRDGQTTSPSEIGANWPASLQPGWRASLGSGYAGAAVVESVVYVPHRRDSQELLAAFDLATGEQLWETAWDTAYQSRMNPDNGPRCVPCVSGDSVVCYGAGGELACVERQTGKLRWVRSLRKQYNAEDGYFGAGSSPIIVGDLAIVCIGGRDGGILGIELASGNTRWTSTDYDASYSSPIALPRGQETLILLETRLQTVLLNANDGSILSEVKFGSRGPTVNAATPIQISPGNYFLTANYGVGATLLSIDGLDLVEKYRGSDLLSSQYNTPVLVNDQVIGINGREDVGLASLRAVDAVGEKVLWEQPDFGCAHLIANGTQVIALKLDGSLALIDGAASEFKSLASTQLPAGTYRALPALTGKRLLVRVNLEPDTSELMMFELP